MPNLDVTDVLYDTDIAGETFQVTRIPIVMTQSGTPSRQGPQTLNGLGSITPATARQLSILPEGTDTQGAISIITPTRLQAGNGTGYEPDMVHWHNADYKVMNVGDWTGFGAGFVQATCTLKTINPASP